MALLTCQILGRAAVVGHRVGPRAARQQERHQRRVPVLCRAHQWREVVRLHGVHVASDGDGQRVDFAVCSSADLNNTLLTRALIVGGNVAEQVTVSQTE